MNPTRRLRSATLAACMALALLAPPAPASLDSAGSLGVTVAGVDDPGSVFALLSEGVRAYAASVSESTGLPTDEFGNPKGPGYQGARQPDTVPTEMAAFLITYYQDKPGFIVAGTASEAASIAAQRAADAAAAAAAAAEAEREKDKENGGDDDGGDRDGGDSGDGGDGGSVDTGDPPNISNPRPGDDDPEDVPDLGEPGAKAEELKEKYGVFIENGTAKFSERELGIIDRVLGGMPRNMYEFKEHPNAPHIQFKRQSGGSPGSIGGFKVKAAEITIDDASGTPEDGEFPGASEEDRKDARLASSVATLVMRVGLAHGHQRGEDIEPGDHNLTRKWANQFGWVRQGDGSYTGDGTGIFQEKPDSPQDEMAQAAGWFFSDPGTLRQVNGQVLDFFVQNGFIQQPDLPKSS